MFYQQNASKHKYIDIIKVIINVNQIKSFHLE